MASPSTPSPDTRKSHSGRNRSTSPRHEESDEDSGFEPPTPSEREAYNRTLQGSKASTIDPPSGSKSAPTKPNKTDQMKHAKRAYGGLDRAHGGNADEGKVYVDPALLKEMEVSPAHLNLIAAKIRDRCIKGQTTEDMILAMMPDPPHTQPSLPWRRLSEPQCRNMNTDYYRTTALGQQRAAYASTKPCSRCIHNSGPFDGCFIVVDRIGSPLLYRACTNCAWGRNYDLCQHSTRYNPKAHQEREQKKLMREPVLAALGIQFQLEPLLQSDDFRRAVRQARTSRLGLQHSYTTAGFEVPPSPLAATTAKQDQAAETRGNHVRQLQINTVLDTLLRATSEQQTEAWMAKQMLEQLDTSALERLTAAVEAPDGYEPAQQGY